MLNNLIIIYTMKYLSFPLLVLLLIITSLSHASKETQKIAVLDWREAILKSSIAAKDVEKINNRIATEKKKIEQQHAKLKKEKESLSKDLQIMPDKEKKEAEAKFAAKLRRFNDLQRQLQQYQLYEEGQLFEKMRGHIDKAISNIVDREKIDILLTKSTIAFTKPKYDITDLLVKELNNIHKSLSK